jgi:hypothetical protein
MLFGTGGGAGLLGGGADRKRRGHVHAPCRLYLCWSCCGEVLRMPRQSCTGNERSGQGEEQAYISRAAPSERPKNHHCIFLGYL